MTAAAKQCVQEGDVKKFTILNECLTTVICGDFCWYRIAGKFGGELNLAVWRYAFKLPN